jgi:CO dehydrogenase nickel-insertion accessory protein CooC1
MKRPKPDISETLVTISGKPGPNRTRVTSIIAYALAMYNAKGVVIVDGGPEKALSKFKTSEQHFQHLLRVRCEAVQPAEQVQP